MFKRPTYLPIMTYPNDYSYCNCWIFVCWLHFCL